MVFISDVGSFEDKVFVVTGGASYAGVRLCLELLRREAREVRCFDFPRSSQPPPLKPPQTPPSEPPNPSSSSPSSPPSSSPDPTSTLSKNNPLASSPFPLHLLAQATAQQPTGRSRLRGRLRTCVLRPAKLFGPGEPSLLRRVMGLVRTGFLRFRIGDQLARSDWLFVDNLVHAQCLAFVGLIPDGSSSGACRGVGSGGVGDVNGTGKGEKDRSCEDGSCKSAGQAYFITDDAPLAVHHVFSTDKAKTDLGYQPIVDPRHAMDATRAYWRRTAQREVPMPPLIVWVLVPLGLALLYLSAFYPRPSLPPPVCWVQDLGVFLFMSRSMLQTVWWTALAIHLTEASIAWMVARNSGGSGARGAEVDGLEWDDGEDGKVGPWSERQNAAEWFVQTFLFGFWSLRLLLRRVVWRMVDSEQNQQ
ncbi:unnamed protein product [Closterium sp. NIES-64]|nr:unnamed protein product [Closterium sp. NIES-64]